MWRMSYLTISHNFIVRSRYESNSNHTNYTCLFNNFTPSFYATGPRVLFVDIVSATRYPSLVRSFRTNVLRQKDHQVSSQREHLFPVCQTVYIFPGILHETSPWPKVFVANLHGEGGKIRYRSRKQNGYRMDWTEQKGNQYVYIYIYI